MTDGPRPLLATKAGPVALNALKTDGQGQITAVFASTFYIDLPGGLIAITTSDIAPGPLNLCTNQTQENWHKSGLMVDTSAHLSNGLIRIPGLFSIDASAPKLWQPEHPAPPSRQTLRKALGDLTALSLTPPPEGYGPSITNPKPEITASQNGLTRALQGDLANFTWALNLLGRGPGLTPAGDDFLGGTLLALHALGHANTARTLWSKLVPQATTRTNQISRALLAAAAEGMGSAPLHTALNALITAKNLTPALAELDKIGHSSGWDAFAGAVTTFRAALARTEATV